MNKYCLDCAGLASREALHQALARTLSFPAYYGNNLDALYDCLTQIGTETELRLLNWKELGDWKKGFQKVFIQARMENPHLTIIL